MDLHEVPVRARGGDRRDSRRGTWGAVMNSAQQPAHCPCCFQGGTAYVSFDKRGNPFLKCGLCRATVFMPTQMATSFLVGSDATIRALLTRTGRTPAQVRADIHAPPGAKQEVGG